jgi:hypothetical protein
VKQSAVARSADIISRFALRISISNSDCVHDAQFFALAATDAILWVDAAGFSRKQATLLDDDCFLRTVQQTGLAGGADAGLYMSDLSEALPLGRGLVAVGVKNCAARACVKACSAFGAKQAFDVMLLFAFAGYGVLRAFLGARAATDAV